MGLWEYSEHVGNREGWIGGLWDGLVGGVKSAFGIQSPSKVFMGIGEKLDACLKKDLAMDYRAYFQKPIG